MSTIEGQYYYASYLNSEEWQKTKEKRFKRLRNKTACELCGRWLLAGQYHHISYRFNNTTNEWKHIRRVHPFCHKYLCHRILFFIRVPNKAVWLKSLYYFWKTVFRFI